MLGNQSAIEREEMSGIFVESCQTYLNINVEVCVVQVDVANTTNKVQV